jgi:hypothetical protein
MYDQRIETIINLKDGFKLKLGGKTESFVRCISFGVSGSATEPKR